MVTKKKFVIMDVETTVTRPRTTRGNISGANALLQSMPVETQDDQWFRDVMGINFKIEAADTLYRLTTQEESLLNTIASAESVMKGYACAILSLCTEYQCDNGYEPPQSLVSFPKPGIQPVSEESTTMHFHVYPNPTSGSLVVMSDRPANGFVEIRVTDLLGKEIVSIAVGNDVIIEESITLPSPGIYILTITQDTQSVFAQKIIRQ